MKAEAVAYGLAGLEIFPCKPDKTPYTVHGFRDATIGRGCIADWWDAHPDASIGCRIPSDLIVLDIDPRHGGLQTWYRLQAEHGPIPETRSHYSGRGDGGGHIWWQRPEGRLSTKQLPGIDLLHHDLRYTILPPSIHAETGRPYQWGAGHGLATPAAVLPVWLERLLVDRTPPVPAYSALDSHTDATQDSVADWWQQQARWADILAGWQLVEGDGETDGSKWRHPTATASFSATVRHGCLFVYSTNTPFEETGADDPHGYTKFRATSLLEDRGDLVATARRLFLVRDGPPLDLVASISKEQAQQPATPVAEVDSRFPVKINWPRFWRQDHDDEQWLIEPFLAGGRSHALYAPAKTGKSLFAFEQVAALATGQATLSQPAGPARDVVYLDYEMTEADVYERLTDMGYGPDDDLTHLHYYLIPTVLPPLDTPAGGLLLVDMAKNDRACLVVIDTTGRAVDGEENEADTIRAYYRHSGSRLKSAGITSLRIDHAGKDMGKGQRGSSAKNDDVDVVWQLTTAANGLKLVATHKRLAWIPETVNLQREDGPLRHKPIGGPLLAAGYDKAVKALDDLGAPDDISTREATMLLREHGHKARNDAIRSAVRFRSQKHDNNIIRALGAPSGAPISVAFNQIDGRERA